MERKFTPEQREKYGTSPEQARDRLEGLGYTFDKWETVLKEGILGGKFGSHEVRALIMIALGTEKRLVGEVYQELRMKEGLLPERD